MTRATKKCICRKFPRAWMAGTFHPRRNLGVFSVFLGYGWFFREFPGYAVIYKWQTTLTLQYMARTTKKFISRKFPRAWIMAGTVHPRTNLGFFPYFWGFSGFFVNFRVML